MKPINLPFVFIFSHLEIRLTNDYRTYEEIHTTKKIFNHVGDAPRRLVVKVSVLRVMQKTGF